MIETFQPRAEPAGGGEGVMAGNEGLSEHAEDGRNSDNAKSANEEVPGNQDVIEIDQDVRL